MILDSDSMLKQENLIWFLDIVNTKETITVKEIMSRLISLIWQLGVIYKS